ncbi:MAG: ankyrin repeat domain-containing protein [bacterium]
MRDKLVCIGVIILTLVFAIAASSMTQKEARAELKKMGIAYDKPNFLAYAGIDDIKVVTLFLDAGMSPNTIGPNLPEKNNDSGLTVLMTAAMGIDTAAVKTALAYSDKFDQEYVNAAKQAMSKITTGGETIEVVNLLLARGANVNAKTNTGYTALMAAGMRGQTEVAKALIAKGAEVNARTDTGLTPLMLPARLGYTSLVKELVEHGAEINEQKNEYRMTPLMLAAMKGNTEVVQFLVDKGAKVDLKNKDGETALMLAKEQKHLDIVEILKQAGAKK